MTTENLAMTGPRFKQDTLSAVFVFFGARLCQRPAAAYRKTFYSLTAHLRNAFLVGNEVTSLKYPQLLKFKLESAIERLIGKRSRDRRDRVLDCGGKADATPLWARTQRSEISTLIVRSKAPPPLRSADAVQNLADLLRSLAQFTILMPPLSLAIRVSYAFHPLRRSATQPRSHSSEVHAFGFLPSPQISQTARARSRTSHQK